MLTLEEKQAVRKLRSKKLASILKVQSTVLKEVQDFMHQKKVIQLLPVMLSPITDPLNHSVFDGEVECYGEKLQLTKSMILHKQLSLLGGMDAIYIISPNIRIEKEEKRETGRHLMEFSQIDFEFRGKTYLEIMRFTEELYSRIYVRVMRECSKELSFLGRRLRTPEFPLKIYDSKKLEQTFGKEWESKLSESIFEPVWVLNHEREFYDKEHPSKPFTYLNYDLIYPEGYGEGLSGAEREYEYKRIIARMKRNKMAPNGYDSYLKVAKAKLLEPSAGAGLGVERLVRYLTGQPRIEDVAPFAKLPGGKFVF